MTDRGTRKHHAAEGGGIPIPGCGSPRRISRGRPDGAGSAPRASVRDRDSTGGRGSMFKSYVAQIRARGRCSRASLNLRNINPNAT